MRATPAPPRSIRTVPRAVFHKELSSVDFAWRAKVVFRTSKVPAEPQAGVKKRKSSVRQCVESPYGATVYGRARKGDSSISDETDQINDSTLDNNSYRASIDSKIGAPPCCCLDCLASCGDLHAQPQRSWCRCRPSRCLCVVQRFATIATADGPSIHTSQYSDRTVWVRRQIQSTTMVARKRSLVPITFVGSSP